jgi:hypothetical protein
MITDIQRKPQSEILASLGSVIDVGVSLRIAME